jgi:tetratricopeptide (TPR) repeat protein
MISSERTELRRFRKAGDVRQEAELQVQAGRLLARRGAHEEARRLFHGALEADPSCVAANLGLARLARDPAERQAYLYQVLALDPLNAEALAGTSAPETPRSEHPSSRRRASQKRAASRVWGLLALTVAAGLMLAAILIWGPVDASLAWLLAPAAPTASPTPTLAPAEIVARFVPQIEAALSGQDWDRALEIVEIMHGLDPSGPEVKHWAPLIHLRYGQDLVQGARYQEALPNFEQAVAWAPGDPEAAQWQQVTGSYLAGESAFAVEDWAAAIEAWAPAYEQLPAYHGLAGRLAEAYRRQGLAAIDAANWDGAIAGLSAGRQHFPDDGEIVRLLSTAYRQRGIYRQEQDELQKARTDLEAALALSPDDTEAQEHYDQVMYILFPPKHIEINITTQHLYAWLGDTLIYSFPVSTGLRGRDTATGHYEVLDKIPMAYSSVWNLQMPYWLGIYYVGNIENGIHALPIRPDGSVMWGGLLGQRASYGCIILSTEAAQLLYEWAEIGTKVDIHY